MVIERIEDVALLRVRGGKANAMSRELLGDLVRLVDEAVASDARALVLTGYERFFSAGLALPLLIDLDRDEMRAFIDFFGNAMLRVFTCDVPVVAAINGHAIAGGCVLALQCDARVMTEGDAKIGLNEVRLGIGLPVSVVEPLRLAVPAASLGPIAMEGGLFSPGEALRLGLVDEVVADASLIERAVARARALAAGSRAAFAQVKRAIRRPALEAMQRHNAEERERWLDTWFSADAQRVLRAAVDRLGARPA